jgi:hypothetical protein
MICDEQGIALIICVYMCGTGDQSTSNTQAKVEEARQRKSEREKARWATMTQEERDEKNKKKRRQAYQLRKAKTTFAGGSRGDTMVKLQPSYYLY